MKSELIEQGVKFILQGLEVQLDDRNYAETPQRFAKMLREMFVPATSSFPTFEESYRGLILARGHKLYTLCPHHLALVEMDIDMAYLPTDEVYGLSKLGRIANSLNTRPMLQEELTRLLAEQLEAIPGCRGSAVVIQGIHGCMKVRGIKAHGDVITSSSTGEFQNPQVWQNFLEFRRRN